MRTTLTLEPDVANLLHEAMEREQGSLKEVVNEALRRGLRAGVPRPSLKIEPHLGPHAPRTSTRLSSPRKSFVSLV